MSVKASLVMVKKKSNGVLKRNRNVKKKLPKAKSALKKKTLPVKKKLPKAKSALKKKTLPKASTTRVVIVNM